MKCFEFRTHEIVSCQTVSCQTGQGTAAADWLSVCAARLARTVKFRSTGELARVLSTKSCQDSFRLTSRLHRQCKQVRFESNFGFPSDVSLTVRLNEGSPSFHPSSRASICSRTAGGPTGGAPPRRAHRRSAQRTPSARR